MKNSTKYQKLHFHCWHRSMQEVDLILGSWIEVYSQEEVLKESEIDDIEKILHKIQDPLLYRWIINIENIPDTLNCVEKLWINIWKNYACYEYYKCHKEKKKEPHI